MSALNDVHLFGIDEAKLRHVLNLWSIAENGRVNKLKDLYNQMDEDVKMLADRMRDNFECSWVWCDLFKEFKKQDKETCAVYFIENSYGDRVKIGMTKQLWRRFEEINQASGGECRVLLAVPVAERYMAHTERMFHLTFGGKRIRGEWFQKEDADGCFVADMVHMLYKSIGAEVD